MNSNEPEGYKLEKQNFWQVKHTQPTDLLQPLITTWVRCTGDLHIALCSTPQWG